MKYLEPMYERLKQRSVVDELLTGLWMMVQAMRERNYLKVGAGRHESCGMSHVVCRVPLWMMAIGDMQLPQGGARPRAL